MLVMSNHVFKDTDIEVVLWGCNENDRELVLHPQNEGAIILSKEDVIALAKEFNLVVYEKDTNL